MYELRGEDEKYAYSDDIRGLYIGETFYLSLGDGLKAFDMAKEYEKMGELSWQ